MATVLLGERPPVLDEWLARRRELGQDRFDEVWEGDYHVAPGPSAQHALVDSRLAQVLWPRAERVGLYPSTAFNLGEPADYRVPDGGLHRHLPSGVFVATAAMVVEIISAGDETLAKLGFYASHGVDEVVVADPAARTIRIWALRPAAEGMCYADTGHSDLLGVDAVTMAGELTWP
jgi:hypothetical protein